MSVRVPMRRTKAYVGNRKVPHMLSRTNLGRKMKPSLHRYNRTSKSLISRGSKMPNLALTKFVMCSSESAFTIN